MPLQQHVFGCPQCFWHQLFSFEHIERSPMECVMIARKLPISTWPTATLTKSQPNQERRSLKLKVCFGVSDRDFEWLLLILLTDSLGRAPCKGGAFLWV